LCYELQTHYTGGLDKTFCIDYESIYTSIFTYIFKISRKEHTNFQKKSQGAFYFSRMMSHIDVAEEKKFFLCQIYQ
jgi:hypothetical protein